MFNVQLLLLSKIGQPYDPVANTGVVGRNFTHQTMSSVNGFFDKTKFNFNPFIASGAIGMCIDEFNGDNFDHGPLGFVGGGYLGQVQTNGRPIETTPVPSGTPKWGAKWKEAVRDNYLSTLKGGSIHGSFYSYRDVYLDLDPTYKDRFGRPLMRMTIDFHDNELKAAAYLTDKYAEIVKAMGAHTGRQAVRARAPTTSPSTRPRISTAAPSWAPIRRPARSTAICRAGTCRTCSCMGASAFPQNAGYNPTGTVAALAFWSAERDPRAVSQKPGAAGRCVSRATIAALRGAALLVAAVAIATRRTRVRSAGFHPDRARPLSRDRRATAPPATRVPDSGKPFAGGRADRDAVRQHRRRRTSRPTARPASAPGATSSSTRRVRKGVRPNGSRLYPAMPYTSYTKMSRDDVHRDPRLSQHRRAGAPSRSSPTRCRFRSTSARRCASGTALYFTPGEFKPDPQQVRRMESRRVPGRRARRIAAPATRRRSFLGGDKTSEISARLVPAGLVRARHHQ